MNDKDKAFVEYVDFLLKNDNATDDERYNELINVCDNHDVEVGDLLA